MHLPFDISISFSSVFECNFFEAFRGDFEIHVTLSANLLHIKSPVTSAVFSIALFEAVFVASAVYILALFRSF